MTADEHDDQVARDARDFGTYARSGSWTFGLMVARSAHPQPPEGSGKVSLADFALRAGCSKDRVQRFHRAWERAAEAGLVPDAEELTPGQDVELPEPELWSEYFTAYERSSERRENIAQQAEVTGTSYGDAVRVAEHPGALRTAILGDSRTAEAARMALLDRLEDDADLQTAMVRSIATNPEIKKAVSVEAKRVDQVEVVRRAALDGKARISSGEITLPDSAMRRAAEHLSTAEDPAATPEDAAAAYQAIQDIVAGVVEEDAQIHAQEQLFKLRKAVVTTVKNVEAIDPGGLVELADDEIRDSILALQRRVNEIVTLIGVRGVVRAA